jgi:hypothetical protein
MSDHPHAPIGQPAVVPQNALLHAQATAPHLTAEIIRRLHLAYCAQDIFRRESLVHVLTEAAGAAERLKQTVEAALVEALEGERK